MTAEPEDALARRVALLALLVFAILASVDAGFGIQATVSFALPVVIASIASSVRVTAVFAFAAVAAALVSGMLHDEDPNVFWFRVVVCAAISATATAGAVVRVRREARLRRMTVIAEAAQRAVLRAMPTAVGDVAFAARYISASEDALIGGDLYEALATPHGVRVIVGDVRGKGMEAVQLAASVLGAFRAAAFTQPSLECVAALLDGAVSAVGGDEDFVTALLVEFKEDGSANMVNCGHHPPLLVFPDGTSRLADTGPHSTPLGLGLGPSPALAQEEWPPGARMLLYTDGLVEARDSEGTFFPLGNYARVALTGQPEESLDRLVAQLCAHTGNRLDDDLALVLAARK